jgi:hypothetical protein
MTFPRPKAPARMSAVAAVVVLASGGGLAAASQSAPAHTPTACVNITGLSELTYRVRADISHGPLPSVGDSGTYDDYLYTSPVNVAGTSLSEDRQMIGLTHGALTVPYMNAAGHPEILLTETFVLRDGTIKASGYLDSASMLGHDWISIDAHGVSGKYKGLVGQRSFKLLEPVPTALFDATFNLCPAATGTTGG